MFTVPRTILHVDMNAFFVSVELLRRPQLRGRPVVVGGTGDRGVVAAASYEARRYGVHSAMPTARARRLCPAAVFLPGDHAHYAAVSRQVIDIFRSYSPLVEPISLDEAFLDVTGSRRVHGEGLSIARTIRQRVSAEQGLECSVGIGASKLVAKLASEAAKPKATVKGIDPGAGIVEVQPGTELQFLHPMPVEALWGVGPSTLQRLGRLGVKTVGDLAALPVGTLRAAFGERHGVHLHELANACDPRPVVSDQPVKSVSHEETFASDHHSLESLIPEVMRLADATASRLRRTGLAGRTVTLKVRFGDFSTITRSVTFQVPTDSRRAITLAARDLLAAIDPSAGIRLLGVAVTNLDASSARQLNLFEPDSVDTGWDQADRAIDQVRGRFGAGAVVPARLVGPDGVRTKRRGDQQWGPTAS